MSSEQFNACTLTPRDVDESYNAGKWKTSSFYLDSSGRSSIYLPLELKFPSKQVLDEFLDAKCIHPAPENMTTKNEESEDQTKGEETCESVNTKLISIEAKVTLTFGTGQAISARVEGVAIKSTRVDGASVIFNTEITVRVSREEKNSDDSSGGGSVKTNLEISAAFAERRSPEIDEETSALEVLNLLNRGVIGSPHRCSMTRLQPFALHVSLTHALSIAVRSVPGPAMGQTFLALMMKHSNTHQQPITVTSINLHASHTRQLENDGTTSSSGTQQQTVTDMSNNVKWNYAPKSDPCLPLTLQPNEAFSTILSVEANEDSLSRHCFCPLSVTAVVGKSSNHVVAATDAKWTTSRAAVEPADSFRIDMSLGEQRIVVGAPVTVHLEISNLSTESRQLMLIVDSETTKKSAVVAEMEGYKFGVWGMSSGPPDDRERELLVVDAALLLGEVKGQASTKAKLRVIPLREGTLSIPNFKLVDSRTGKRYNCVHKLQAVAAQTSS